MSRVAAIRFLRRQVSKYSIVDTYDICRCLLGPLENSLKSVKSSSDVLLFAYKNLKAGSGSNNSLEVSNS